MDNKNYIVTAATANYFRSFQQLFYTYLRSKEYENSKMILFDLGLKEHQIQHIRNDLQKKHSALVYRKFDFHQYPEFFKPHYHTYSWKPAIIYEMLFEKKGNILWLDCANLILKTLQPVWEAINTTGSFIPFSGSGSLKEWTMQSTLDYLKVPSEQYTQRNRAGNTCGFSYQHPVIRHIVEKWNELAYIRECIRPEGANRSNHRDDQSLLTILLLNEQDRGRIQLTDQEVDISSDRPTAYFSVRNNLDKKRFLPVGWVALMYFRMIRHIDININKIKKHWL